MKFLSLTIPGVGNVPAPKGIPSGGINTVGHIFTNTLSLFLILTVSLALIYMVIAGIQWITSGGDKNKLQAARGKLTWAIIGLVIAFTAFAIVSLLGYLFDVPLMSFP